MENNKKYYEDIFVVLTYKNTTDIIDLIDSLEKKVKYFHVIIVNSYYSDEVRETFRKIAEKFNYDFLSIENKGYGYGNNCGIKFVLENYEFKRLIISNPDIIIEDYNQAELNRLPSGVIGGIITNAKGKKQNPLRVYDYKFTNNSAYYLYVKKNKLFFYMSVILAKLQRSVILFKKTNYQRVFAIHGSFFVITRDVFNTVEKKLFDENIFMYGEEIDIAKMLKNKRIYIYFTRLFSVLHKEDGDINISNVNNSKIMTDSCLYLHKKWK